MWGGPKQHPKIQTSDPRFVRLGEFCLWSGWNFPAWCPGGRRPLIAGRLSLQRLGIDLRAVLAGVSAKCQPQTKGPRAESRRQVSSETPCGPGSCFWFFLFSSHAKMSASSPDCAGAQPSHTYGPGSFHPLKSESLPDCRPS